MPGNVVPVIPITTHDPKVAYALRNPPMDGRYENVKIALLILKLIEIGQAARQDASTVRPLVIEAEDFALDLQREILALRQENEWLRTTATHE
jgi:hypothetical protein